MAALGLLSNFQYEVPTIPGVNIVMAGLGIVSLFVLSVFGIPGKTVGTLDRILRYGLLCLGIAAVLLAVLWNEFIISRFLSSDGTLQPSTVSAIRWLQLILASGGITVLLLRSRIGASIHWLAKAAGSGGEFIKQSFNIKLLVLSLIIPWAILLLLVESPGKLQRLAQLWPLQVIFLAASMTYVLPLLKVPRLIAVIGSLVLIFIVADNTVVESRVAAWQRDGWSGTEPEEVQAIHYVADRLNGKNQAAIGYQFYIMPFVATYNVRDSRYKVGANLDLLLRDLHGVSNTNHCAEGFASNDEFRIVETKPGSNVVGEKDHFDIPIEGSFHVARQFGSIQVIERTATSVRQ
jgi:hypothetical protein